MIDKFLDKTRNSAPIFNLDRLTPFQDPVAPSLATWENSSLASSKQRMAGWQVATIRALSTNRPLINTAWRVCRDNSRLFKLTCLHLANYECAETFRSQHVCSLPGIVVITRPRTYFGRVNACIIN